MCAELSSLKHCAVLILSRADTNLYSFIKRFNHIPFRSFGRIIDDVFTGESLVDWLINVGLVPDRIEGKELCTKLVGCNQKPTTCRIIPTIDYTH